jgi:hypothetical protein
VTLQGVAFAVAPSPDLTVPRQPSVDDQCRHRQRRIAPLLFQYCPSKATASANGVLNVIRMRLVTVPKQEMKKATPAPSLMRTGSRIVVMVALIDIPMISRALRGGVRT